MAFLAATVGALFNKMHNIHASHYGQHGVCMVRCHQLEKNERNHRENPRLVQNELQWRLGT